jgi:hypothetical protein
MVVKHETNRKGQSFFEESEESDAMQGSVGGIEAW